MSRVITQPRLARAPRRTQSATSFLQSLRWAEGADELIAASGEGDEKRFAKELRRNLRRRFGQKRESASRFSSRYPGSEAIAREVYQRIAEDFEAGAGIPDLASSPARLPALLEGLRRLGAGVKPASLLPLWRATFDGGAAIANSETPATSPLARMLEAEILWASSILFDGLAGTRERRTEARKKILEEFDERTDTDGAPHAELLEVLPAWLASLNRCIAWASAADVRLWSRGFADRFDGLVQAVAILTRPDGRLCLGPDIDVRPTLAESLKRSGLKSDAPASRLIARLGSLGDRSLRTSFAGPLSRSDRKQPPVVQSDWGHLSIARSRWRPEADLLAVSHAGAMPLVEVLALGQPLFGGNWDLRIRLNGADLALDAEWENVSWFSDKDADYVELQCSNSAGVIVCRQALLTRDDHQLVIADAISIPQQPETRVEVEATVPLAPGIIAETCRPLREVRLEAAGLPVRCFPIGLPMESMESAAGSLEASERQIKLRGAGFGGVYLPLVFDWNPGRREAAADWRSLTVTEDRRRLTSGETSAHRLRVGERQLFVYRSLDGSKSMRAVLGHHHGNESIIARFEKGDVEPLVLVE